MVRKRGREDTYGAPWALRSRDQMAIFLRSCFLKTREKQHLVRVSDNQFILLRCSLLSPDGRGASERPHHVGRDQPVVSLCDVRPVVGRPTDRRPAARQMTTGLLATRQPMTGRLMAGDWLRRSVTENKQRDDQRQCSSLCRDAGRWCALPRGRSRHFGLHPCARLAVIARLAASTQVTSAVTARLAASMQVTRR